MAVDANTTAFIETMAATTTGAITVVTQSLTLFTCAPLNYFLGFAVACMGLKVVRRLMLGGGRRR